MVKKLNTLVKINGHLIGGQIFGVKTWIETIPTITYPRNKYKKEVIPERFLPNYLKQKETVSGSMVLVINTVETSGVVVGRTGTTLFYEKVINKLDHLATIEIEFLERKGLLYICKLASGTTVENMLNNKNAYKYVLDLEILEVKIKGT